MINYASFNVKINKVALISFNKIVKLPKYYIILWPLTETIPYLMHDHKILHDIRDANLWRPKIGSLSFFYPPPPKKIDPAPNGNDLGHNMTSYMMYILSKFEC